ncbi:MAG: DUF362 domain-containing protein [Candidatus Abyssobacteria bacterium SURF_17]|uniref:DUF362 domain-containing protein n=1 Tax=Candidatus Abyssobacteria bacterium SURF_17 TaxID=2093361 RepID=A0A419EUK9_9BACT|nr:MAG: DUF362 domain-containing protein [Candidatus Abyssubacteria bacterium SURF_17]
MSSVRVSPESKKTEKAAVQKARVAVLKTTPETVLEDYGRLMRLAEYEKYLPKDKDTALKINISWHVFYPACSTAPWQLDGVIKTMLEDGYKREHIHGCHNRTVVVDARVGEVNNKQRQMVVDKYGLRNVHLYENERWVRYEPKGEILVLNDIYPDGIYIPERFIGENILHLPTMKTHVFTTMTGAMKNAFGGLLQERRHWTHSVIHETLVDLLTIQKEIHSGIFAVMDGTFAGDGPGPRCMRVHVKDYILASADQVAIDAVAARMMGFDPMSLDFIRIAHEKGLGCGVVEDMEIVGEDISGVNWRFEGKKDTFASRGQKAIYHGPLKPLEKLLLRTPLVPWSYLASRFYHDGLWYPLVGRKRVKEALETKWGKLFNQY